MWFDNFILGADAKISLSFALENDMLMNRMRLVLMPLNNAGIERVRIVMPFLA